jgi:hypothetical protein
VQDGSRERQTALHPGRIAADAVRERVGDPEAFGCLGDPGIARRDAVELGRVLEVVETGQPPTGPARR